MELDNERSHVQEFFAGKTIFLTGSSGFLGKMTLEKLLRVCPDIKKVYILLRTKKNKDPQKRLEELFTGVVFEQLNSQQPDIKQKVTCITGDCAEPNLGMSPEGRGAVMAEVDVILHYAATVNFDETLKMATNINVRAVRDLIKMAKEMPQLQSFLYVSTAYSNCVRKDIAEKFYDAPVKGEQLMNIMDSLNDKLVAAITPEILGEYPNTYVFTKSVAEDVVRTEGRGLPIAVFRPSIVISSKTEPVPGWIDNVYGPTGVLLGAAIGLMRVLHCIGTNVADMVPADYVINSAILSTVDANKKFQKRELVTDEEHFEADIPIYNYVSSVQKPIIWNTFMELAYKHGNKIPTPLIIWHYMFYLVENAFIYKLGTFFLHMLPAYIVDTIATCIGRKPMLVKGYEKIHKFSKVISYFCTRQWDFNNDNTQLLWQQQTEKDKALFSCDMGSFDWDSFFATYMQGCRIYLLKDPLDTIPEGRRKFHRLRFAHYTILGLLLLALYKAIAWLLTALFT